MNLKEFKDIEWIPSIDGIGLQKYQKFIRNYVNLNTIYNELLVFHKPGAGKTLAALLVAEMYRKNLSDINGKVLIIGSFVSRQEFIKTLTSPLINIANNIPSDNPNNIFISKEEEDEFEKYSDKDEGEKKKKKMILERLNEVGYVFMSYQKFMNNNLGNIDNYLVIVDESHNLLNNNKYNQALKNLIEVSKRYKILLLTATPMFNSPHDIVNHANMMFKKKDELKYGKVFDKDGNIQKDGLLYLQVKLKGKVSYIRGSNPKYFPEEREVGEILSQESIAGTRVIRVPMSDIQYKAYSEIYDGQMTQDIRNILNFTFKNGIYKDLEKYGKKYGDKKYLYLGSDKRLHGKSLERSELSKYSPKYVKCLDDLKKTNYGVEKGKCFIFNSYVNNSGIKLFGSILEENGYVQYGESLNPRDDYKRFVLYYQDTPKYIREKIINVFNSKENRYGKKIKILIGSTLTKEGLDLKAVKHVFILSYQDNFSRIEQIKGRGIRLKSHMDLPEDERFTYVYKYVSTLPGDESEKSIEELEYMKNEKDMINIKKIERALKIAAVDCQFNREFNIFPDDKDYSVECGFDKCDYKCMYPVPIEKDEDFDLTYKLFYKDEEIFEAKEYIKYLFKDNLVMDLYTILDKISGKKILKDFGYVALNKLVEEKEIFEDGYLIQKGGNYFFQPQSILETDIDLNMRTLGSSGKIERRSNLNDVFTSLTIEESELYTADIEGLRKKLKGKDFIEASLILSKMSNIGKIQTLEDALKNYISRDISEIDFFILKYFKRYLIDENQLKSSLNNLNTDEYFSSISMDSIDKNKKFIGHFLSPVAQIYDRKKKVFRDISEDFIKRKTKRTYKENDFIIGFMDKDKLGNLQFKLRYVASGDKTGIIGEDKRKLKRGFVCRYTNDKKELIDIGIKLGIKEILDKRSRRKIKIARLCELLEKDLREKQIYSDKNNLGIRWFYDYEI